MKLLLEDGTELAGESFGASGAVTGEVVFSTAMTGYVETLTDPSFRGQILVLTYPLQGNYGVPAPRSLGTLDGPYESAKIQVQGLVVQSYVPTPSHSDSRRSLGDWLDSEDVPGLTGIDTRVLTQKLREHGTLRGWLVPDGASRADAARSSRWLPHPPAGSRRRGPLDHRPHARASRGGRPPRPPHAPQLAAGRRIDEAPRALS